MRITHNMMTRNYMSNLNKNLRNLTQSNDKLSSQRSFNKSWENVSGANRALRVREMLQDNDRYTANLQDITGTYTAAEDSMRAVSDVLANVGNKLLHASNGSLSNQDREQIAKEIENLQNEVFQITNMEYNNKHVFSAAGSATGGAPFTYDPNGKLLFNGTPVDDMQVNADGQPMKPDGSGPIDFNKHNYIDVGLGLKMQDDGKGGTELDTRTALRSTFSGVEVFGFGTEANGMPNNLVSLLGKISNDMKTGNSDTLMEDFDHLRLQQNKLLMNVTDVGNLSSYSEQLTDRIRNDTLNLQTMQNNVEAVPLSEEIMYNKDFEMAWMVTLQLGSKILPPSIFDFMR